MKTIAVIIWTLIVIYFFCIFIFFKYRMVIIPFFNSLLSTKELKEIEEKISSLIDEDIEYNENELQEFSKTETISVTEIKNSEGKLILPTE